jgi:acetyl esterase/lipase
VNYHRSIIEKSTAILLIYAGVVSVSARGAEPPKTTTEQDIVYKKAGSTELKLDLARPAEGDGPFPAMLVIHGGAWRAGSKADMRPILPQFTGRGYVAVAPQYRLCPADAFPAQVHDMKAAVRWLKVNAKKYKVDPDRIGAIGFSAGGHLALMLGLTSPADGLEGEVSAGSPDSRIKAVVNYFGPTELAASDIPEVCKPWINDFLGGTPQAKPSAASQASPLTFVSRDDAPILTFQGTKDPLVPFTQAIKLAEAMSSAGVSGRVELLIGAEHGWAGAELERTVGDSFQFLDRHLKGAATSSKP